MVSELNYMRLFMDLDTSHYPEMAPPSDFDPGPPGATAMKPCGSWWCEDSAATHLDRPRCVPCEEMLVATMAGAEVDVRIALGLDVDDDLTEADAWVDVRARYLTLLAREVESILTEGARRRYRIDVREFQLPLERRAYFNIDDLTVNAEIDARVRRHIPPDEELRPGDRLILASRYEELVEERVRALCDDVRRQEYLDAQGNSFVEVPDETSFTDRPRVLRLVVDEEG
ncbi:hypothetical protein B8281_15970 [Cellulosimicrobium sp. TH-20]|uniref:hypothetical protein n=1 Tax=Cellulosimicrobium sp. TH-20 TaxID=1980001 RepID=UPI000A17B6F8|nr:hypothetical protein [Cellulosimicrobium sp. TH-20]ARK05989.1 hypothetical protein B8281_15970 [Cellulosimicrobium sp. TH-20]